MKVLLIDDHPLILSAMQSVILGLDRPTSGTATVGGRLYRELDHPLRQVGALLLGRIDCEWAVGEVMLQRIVAEADLFMTGALEFDLQALS